MDTIITMDVYGGAPEEALEAGEQLIRSLEQKWSVTAEGRLCDVLSTAAFVMGRERAGDYWRSHEGFEMILVTDENEIYLTEGLEGAFSLNEMSQGIPVHVVRR